MRVRSTPNSTKSKYNNNSKSRVIAITRRLVTLARTRLTTRRIVTIVRTRIITIIVMQIQGNNSNKKSNSNNSKRYYKIRVPLGLVGICTNIVGTLEDYVV